MGVDWVAVEALWDLPFYPRALGEAIGREGWKRGECVYLGAVN